MTQKEFYKSRAWRRARDAYIQRRIRFDGGICEVCRRELGKIVHHKIWLNDINCNDPEISLAESNLRYECQDCHNKEKDPSKIVAGRYRFDADGNIIRIESGGTNL